MTTTQAAEALKISRSAVLKLLERGLLDGDKPGRDWIITEAAVERYRTERRPQGWPKRGK